ncbi:MAG TPA: hypothetical protein VJ647_03775, partial [Chitinophagaceae bacterium]|nr:hypothetical protein [Chitinophagaceae bacterium]
KRGRSAHNVALQDAFNAPEILGIIRQGYQGRIGDIIVVQALDDFRVTGVPGRSLILIHPASSCWDA